MKLRPHICVSVIAATCAVIAAQESSSFVGPDPREIPIPPIKTPLGKMPGVSELPVHKEMPDVMALNDGTKVKTRRQWQKRRDEMKRILEYYAVGQMPPPPRNVKGKTIKSETALEGKSELPARSSDVRPRREAQP